MSSSPQENKPKATNEQIEAIKAELLEKGIELKSDGTHTKEEALIILDVMEKHNVDTGINAVNPPLEDNNVELDETKLEQPISFVDAAEMQLTNTEVKALKDMPELYKRTMYLKEIQKEEHSDLYKKLIDKHIVSATKDESDDLEGDQFLKAVYKYSHIEEDPEFEGIRATVDERIAKVTDRALIDNLKKAGYTKEEIKSFNSEAMDSLRLQKAFFSDVVYEDGNKKQIGQAFNNALAANKDAILGFLSNPRTQFALNGLGLALAVSSGGTIPLIMQGVKFAGMALKNETVQGVFKNFANRIEAKCADYGIDITPAKEAVQKVSDFVEKNKPQGKSRFALAIAGSIVLVGLGVAMDPNTELGKAANALAQETSTMVNDLTGVDLSAQTAGVEASTTVETPSEPVKAADAAVTEPATTEPATTEPVITEHTVKSGDSASAIAKDAYLKATGVAPTEQQIVAIVNDMGLENPASIRPGDTYKLPNTFDQYAADKIGKVNADWLGQTPVEPAAIQPADVMESLTVPPSSLDLSGSYDIQKLADQLAPGISLADIQRMNPNVDIFNLSPGDEMLIGSTEYNVPELSDAILKATFGDVKVPEFIDKDAYIEMIKDANPDRDLSEGWFGVEMLGGNGDIGADMAQDGNLSIPPIDPASILPQAGDTVVSGVVHNNNINHLLLGAAFPNGVPDIIDSSKYLATVRDMNAGLINMDHGDYFAKTIYLPTLEEVQAFHEPKVEMSELEAKGLVEDVPAVEEATTRGKTIDAEAMKEKAQQMAAKQKDAGLAM